MLMRMLPKRNKTLGEIKPVRLIAKTNDIPATPSKRYQCLGAALVLFG
jgi:hypothetical protein